MNSTTERKKSVLDAFFAQSITKDEMRMMNEKYDSDIADLNDKIEATREKEILSYFGD